MSRLAWGGPACDQYLSEGPVQAAQLVVSGHTYKEIAQGLERSPATIRNQIQSIYAKLEVGASPA